MMRSTVNTQKLAVAVRLKRGDRTLREVAKEVDMPYSLISRIENEKMPSLQTLLKLCDWLKMSPDEFIQKQDPAHA